METERLILRRYKKEDLDYRINSDEFIAVETKDNHKMIGNIYFSKRDFNSFEIGYVFNNKYWGKGYASEACKAIINEAFSKGTHKIIAHCDPLNPNSWNLLERLGFEREAHLKENVYFWVDDDNNPIWKDTFIYGLLKKFD